MPDTTGDDILDRLVDTFEAARILCQSPGTLRMQRTYGGGCAYVKLGRSVRYRVRDIEMHMAKNRFSNTSEYRHSG